MIPTEVTEKWVEPLRSDHLERHLWSDSDAVPYPELAKLLDMSLSAVKVSAYRLRCSLPPVGDRRSRAP